jgi:hypothetical protein
MRAAASPSSGSGFIVTTHIYSTLLSTSLDDALQRGFFLSKSNGIITGAPARLLCRAIAADNAAMETEPNRKRRWFQFSLRTLLIFTALVAIACGWLGSKIERKLQEA